jgi:alpha-aminoadipate carrier protein LysW
MSTAQCVECDASIEIADGSLIGQIVQCGECGAELEIVTTDPVSLELAPEVEEDWGE